MPCMLSMSGLFLSLRSSTLSSLFGAALESGRVHKNYSGLIHSLFILMKEWFSKCQISCYRCSFGHNATAESYALCLSSMASTGKAHRFLMFFIRIVMFIQDLHVTQERNSFCNVLRSSRNSYRTI